MVEAYAPHVTQVMNARLFERAGSRSANCWERPRGFHDLDYTGRVGRPVDGRQAVPVSSVDGVALRPRGAARLPRPVKMPAKVPSPQTQFSVL